MSGPVISSGRRSRVSSAVMGDTLSSGRTSRTLNIVDQYSRECMALEVDRSLPG